MQQNGMHQIALGLGTNLGRRERQLTEALRRLQLKGVVITRCSSFYDTDPVDCVPGTPRFLNAVAVGRWRGTPRQLLNLCKQIETEMGRPPDHSSSESRVIDIDILLFNEEIIREKHLLVPHPRMTERRFILEPLNEIAPAWRVPPGQDTVAELFQRLTPDEPGRSGSRPRSN